MIRDANEKDRAAIRALVEAAFDGSVEASLVEMLRASGDAAIELVAEGDGALTGHILLSRLVSPENCLALAPLSAAPAMQKRGVGGALARAAIESAKKQGFAAIFLLGEPGYYQRFGFSVAAAAKFETVYPKDYMMALALTEGALDRVSGKVVYAAPFAAFE